jgi:hypothetical protein
MPTEEEEDEEEEEEVPGTSPGSSSFIAMNEGGRWARPRDAGKGQRKGGRKDLTWLQQRPRHNLCEHDRCVNFTLSLEELASGAKPVTPPPEKKTIVALVCIMPSGTACTTHTWLPKP